MRHESCGMTPHVTQCPPSPGPCSSTLASLNAVAPDRSERGARQGG